MDQSILELKARIFGLEAIVSQTLKEDIDTGRFTLEEVLEWLARQEGKPIIMHESRPLDIEELDKSFFFPDEHIRPKPKVLLYDVGKGYYYVYKQREGPKKGEHRMDQPKLYVPTGVVVRMVPSSILGNGVLGRAFLHQNYIEILNTLAGADYTEVLTHELLHIRHPEYGEMKVRQITRTYIPNSRYN